MPMFRILLLPFSFLYKLVTDLRNSVYDSGSKASMDFDRFVISVGNLTVGGTGKTPFVELLIRALESKYNVAVLSRGYKRKTKGFKLADESDDASSLGDEPFQYFIKYGKKSMVAVGEDRALAIPQIISHNPKNEIVILDDAYQHRRVKPQLNILLNDYNRPFYKDLVLPAGRLRESRKHANRADVIVVTKCPKGLNSMEMEGIEKQIKKYSRSETPIYFTGIKYLKPQRLFGNEEFSNNVFLFSGIANAAPLVKYVSEQYNLIGDKGYPDHHAYSESELKSLLKNFEEVDVKQKCLLTTEKDMVRLVGLKEEAGFLQDCPLFYLPIELYFLRNGDFFADSLLEEVEAGLLELRNN